MGLRDIDFNDLEFEEIGLWPLEVRVLTFAVITLISIAAGYYFIVKKQMDLLSSLEREQHQLRQEYQRKHNRSANLEAYKSQLVEIRNTFKTLRTQLPSEVDVARLIDDISLQAGAYGIDFKRIKPGNELQKGFYAELPIELSMVGRYHSLGKFVSGISKIPRIITLHDFNIRKPRGTTQQKNKEEVDPTMLEMTIQAKTYWYTKDNEQ